MQYKAWFSSSFSLQKKQKQNKQKKECQIKTNHACMYVVADSHQKSRLFDWNPYGQVLDLTEPLNNQ